MLRRNNFHNFPEVNVCCTVSASKVYEPFFYAKQTVKGVAYPEMLQQWLAPYLQKDKADFILQQDGASAHFLGNFVIALMLNFLIVGLDVLLEMTIPFFCGLHAHLI